MCIFKDKQHKEDVESGLVGLILNTQGWLYTTNKNRIEDGDEGENCKIICGGAVFYFVY